MLFLNSILQILRLIYSCLKCFSYIIYMFIFIMCSYLFTFVIYIYYYIATFIWSINYSSYVTMEILKFIGRPPKKIPRSPIYLVYLFYATTVYTNPPSAIVKILYRVNFAIAIVPLFVDRKRLQSRLVFDSFLRFRDRPADNVSFSTFVYTD